MRHTLLTVCVAAGVLGLLPDPATAQFCDCDVSASGRAKLAVRCSLDDNPRLW